MGTKRSQKQSQQRARYNHWLTVTTPFITCSRGEDTGEEDEARDTQDVR